MKIQSYPTQVSFYIEGARQANIIDNALARFIVYDSKFDVFFKKKAKEVHAKFLREREKNYHHYEYKIYFDLEEFSVLFFALVEFGKYLIRSSKRITNASFEGRKNIILFILERHQSAIKEIAGIREPYTSPLINYNQGEE